MIYRLVPVLNKNETPNVNVEAAYANMMNKFRCGAAHRKGIYYDEENRRRLNYIRLAHSQVALNLVNAGQKEKARQLLEHFDQQYDAKDFPYGMTSNRGNQHNAISLQYLQACYFAGDKSLAKKIDASVRKDLHQQLQYYISLGDEQSNEENMAANALALLKNQNSALDDRQAPFANDILSSYQFLNQLDTWQKEFQ